MRLETLDDKGRVLSLTALEKAVISLFSTITFAMLAWVTFTTNQTSKDLIAVQTSIDFIKDDTRVADLARRVTELERYHRGKTIE